MIDDDKAAGDAGGSTHHLAPLQLELPFAAERRRPYRVLIDDLFHFGNIERMEEERYEFGAFDTPAEALAACEFVVNRCLQWLYVQKPGISAGELLEHYLGFGDDPFVRADRDHERVDFSARDYAETRVKIIAGQASELQSQVLDLDEAVVRIAGRLRAPRA